MNLLDQNFWPRIEELLRFGPQRDWQLGGATETKDESICRSDVACVLVDEKGASADSKVRCTDS